MNAHGNWGNWSAIRNFTVSWSGTITARAVQVDPTDTSCVAIRKSPIGLDGTVHQFTVAPPDPLTQSGNTYVTFANAVPGPYVIMPDPPDGYVVARYCWQRTTAPTTGETQSAVLSSGDTLTWDVGYTLGTP